MDRPPRTRWPSGLLGTLAIIAAVEASLAASPLRFADTASLNWRLAADDVDREAARTEIACLGDSLTKIGVVPEVIRAGTGKRTYNFAMARAPAQATYFLLRRLIEAGGRPSAVVVDFMPSIQAGRPRLGLRHFQEIATAREAWELARDDGSFQFLAPFLLGRLLPSIRYRLEIRESVLSALGGEVAPTIRTNRLALRNWSINLGNHLNPPTPFSGAVPDHLTRNLGVEKWRCHRINELYIDRLFDLARSRSIAVYWIIPPLSPPLQSHRDRAGAEGEYTGFVRSMQARHPEIRVVDGRRAGYASSAFADSTHLNGRGSMAFSHELAAILKDPEGRPGWIDLPPYRDWPVDVPAEDIDQSRVAVESGPARR